MFVVLKSTSPVLTYQAPDHLFQMVINLAFPQAYQPNTLKQNKKQQQNPEKNPYLFK